MSNTAKNISDSDTLNFNDLPASFDVALSFAGEERVYVGKVREVLQKVGLSVFYDEDYKVALWGKQLTEVLPDIYCNRSKVVVLFVSEAYSKKDWTRLERRSALERALREKSEYVLPARFDKTELPGLSSTISYIDLSKIDPTSFAGLIIQKLGVFSKTVPQGSNTRATGTVDPTASLINHISSKEELARYRIGEGVEDAHSEITSLFSQVANRVQELINKAPNLNLSCGGNQRHLVARRSSRGACTLEMQFQQTYRNKFDDAQLIITLWKGLRVIPGKSEIILPTPFGGTAERMSFATYTLACNKLKSWQWTGGDKSNLSHSTEELSSIIFSDFVELIKAHHPDD